MVLYSDILIIAKFIHRRTRHLNNLFYLVFNKQL